MISCLLHIKPLGKLEVVEVQKYEPAYYCDRV